jgi:hypothetical protein
MQEKNEKKNACQNCIGNPKGKRLLRGRIYRWEDNIKMDFREVG